MSPFVPGIGGVQPAGRQPERDPSRDASAPTRSGAWRPNEPFRHGAEGIKITMRRARGLTPKGFLEVPFRFQVPVTNELRRPWRHDWPTHDTLSAGEQARDGGAKLDRLAFTTMFVDEAYDWIAWDGVLNPQRLLDELRSIMKRPAPFRLTLAQPGLWGPRPLVNMTAVLTSVEPTSRGSGNVGTEFTSVEFQELEHHRISQRKTRRPSDRDQDRRHRLRAGDTLYEIARHYFKAASAWKPIRDANGIQGVSPDSAAELAAWAKRHHRETLVLPARPGDVTDDARAGDVLAGGVVAPVVRG